eukprot:COSAG02_NODE_36094_length_459_cov_0.713889_1_plen_39_part_10
MPIRKNDECCCFLRSRPEVGPDNQGFAVLTDKTVQHREY